MVRGNARLAVQLGNKGQQGDVPSALDCHGQAPLVLGAGARLATRADLATVTHEPLEQPDVLVVDAIVAFSTELAYLGPSRETAAVISSVIAHSLDLLQLHFVRICVRGICGIPIVVVDIVRALVSIKEDELLSDQLGTIVAFRFGAFPVSCLEPALNVD